mmetsp:Transcript_7690/g.7575  ORF Transcript_7690/g.7575 Transcript_7690/m.7575 type:complete len:85 (+) Transcript_7690:230-484(+)
MIIMAVSFRSLSNNNKQNNDRNQYKYKYKYNEHKYDAHEKELSNYPEEKNCSGVDGLLYSTLVYSTILLLLVKDLRYLRYVTSP